MAEILHRTVRSGNARLRPEIHSCIRGARVRAEPAIRNLELQSEGAETDLIVSVQTEIDPTRGWKGEAEVLVPVPDSANIAPNAEPAFGIDSEKTGHIETVAGWNVVGELTLRLGDCEVGAHGKARRNLRSVVDDLCVDEGRRRENASSAQ